MEGTPPDQVQVLSTVMLAYGLELSLTSPAESGLLAMAGQALRGVGQGSSSAS